jgi:hypothetical protein
MEKNLNGLGKEGWELIAFIPVGGNVQCIFKREVISTKRPSGATQMGDA